jgi:hypothetical protein
MKLYYLNRYPNQEGYCELHLISCNQLPNIFNRICLGDFETQEEALLDSKKKHPKTIYCTNCLEANQNNTKPTPFFKKWFFKK